ncbi:MAG TPA: hypothetical protein VF053_17865 [Streptosporangiales bacterium]
MYQKAAAAAGAAGAGTLPFTGGNAVYVVIAAFALLACGAAILRIVPRVRTSRK